MRRKIPGVTTVRIGNQVLALSDLQLSDILKLLKKPKGKK